MSRLSLRVTLITGLVSCHALAAKDNRCEQAAALAQMIGSTSVAQLNSGWSKVEHDYRAQVVFASRWLELRPKEQEAAALLLSLLPKDERQQEILMTLGDSQCEKETISTMTLLGKLRDSLPHDWSTAVALMPGRLPDYVAYALISTQDPHSDYALQMQSVCRLRRHEFNQAVARLPSDKRSFFTTRIFDPKSCRPLALPEAELGNSGWRIGSSEEMGSAPHFP